MNLRNLGDSIDLLSTVTQSVTQKNLGDSIDLLSTVTKSVTQKNLGDSIDLLSTVTQLRAGQLSHLNFSGS